MSETQTAPHPARVKALELANQHAAEPAKIVERANAYHGFLVGAAAATTAPKTNGAAAPATTAAPKTTTAAAAAGPKAGATTAAAKPAAKPGAATTAKPGAATTAKPGAATTAKPGAKAPTTPIPMTDVMTALRNVMNSNPDKEAGRVTARAILQNEGKVTAVKDLKPDLYKAVIDACNAALAKTTAAAAAAPEAEFDSGPAISEDETAVDTDPPEQTGGGASADGEDL
jgi:hypothetical protein